MSNLDFFICLSLISMLLNIYLWVSLSSQRKETRRIYQLYVIELGMNICRVSSELMDYIKTSTKEKS